MKTKYIIRETSSFTNKPPHDKYYFHGFLRGVGVTLVLGFKHAQEYDNQDAAKHILKRIKEVSGRDTWEVYIKPKPCKCGRYRDDHIPQLGRLYCTIKMKEEYAPQE